jgi:flagellar hook protein FlgE
MQQSMRSAISGLRNHQTFMDVVAHNIANANTPAYKQERISFQDLLSQTFSRGRAPADDGSTGGVNPVQVGLGLNAGSIDIVFTQGALEATGRPSDVSVQGNGLFTLVGPGNALFYTRDGTFDLDRDGNLVHLPTGYLVAGDAGTPIGQIFDPAVDTDVVSWDIDTDGEVIITRVDGTTEVRGQIFLARFANANGLQNVGQNLFRPSLNSGDPVYGQPASAGYGEITAGYLERSNVDLAKNLTDMILAQRGFQANSRIVSASDQMLQDLVNLGR